MAAWLLRHLVRLIRHRRHAETPARIRALEVGLGLAKPTFSEVYARPEMIDWGSGRRDRKERERFERLHGRPPAKGGYMAANVTVAEMGALPEVLTKPAERSARAAERAVARDVEASGEWHATRHATLPLIQVDVVTGDGDGNIVEYVAEDVGRSNGVHIAAWSPVRVLAEIAAKRKLLALHDMCDSGYGPCDETGIVTPCVTQRLLAAPYADHADFDRAWKIDD